LIATSNTSLNHSIFKKVLNPNIVESDYDNITGDKRMQEYNNSKMTVNKIKENYIKMIK
jgi:hypothetical protein